MSRTISSSTIGPVVLGTADTPLYITSTGMVTSTGSADGIDGGAGTTWTITNAGVVSAISGNGVSLASSGTIGNTGSISGNDALVLRAGGSVTNNAGGSISGLGALGAGLGTGSGVYITGAAGTVTNQGSISGAAYGVGLAAGGLVTNTSSITGGEDGVIVHGAVGTVANSGNITATVDDGVALFAGGSVTNASGASISGAGGAGIFITGGLGTVTNAGSIAGLTHHGVLIAGGGSLSNAATGSISALGVGVFFESQAGALTNAGFITGTGTQGTGVYLENGGSATNTSTGTISGQKFGAFLEGGFTTLANYGSISGATYDGVVLGLGGTVTNAAGASIKGGSIGVYVKYRAAGTVTNSGSIGASGTGSAGIDLADGGSVTNNSTGAISGDSFGVFVTGAGGAVTNNGSITSVKYGGVELVKGGSVTNSAGASIKGGSIGVYAGSGGTGTLTNSGSINAASASGAGVDFAGGGSITNNSGGAISGSAFGVFTSGVAGTLNNSGSISGSHGVGLEAGGSVTNAASASITGQVAGVFAQGGAATLSNAGSIVATAGAGLDIEGGGSITNLAGATISGSSFGIFLTGGAGTVTNAGTISGGSYAIDFAGSATNRLVVDPGAVFVGKVTGSGTNTLELAGGTGSGSIGGVGTGSFNNFQVVAVDVGASWTLTGANIAPTILDNGTVSIAGSLDASTAIDASSTGLFQLGSGAIFEVAAATGTSALINFLGSSSELIIDNAASFGINVGTASYAGPQLQHFVSGDKIDLKGFSSAGLTLSYNASTGVLQVSNSANQRASLDFQTASLGSATFQATGDGATGIFITTTGPTVTESLTIDTGSSAIDRITSNDALTGTGLANTVVHFTIDGSPIVATVTADAQGAWSFTPSGLADGPHTIVASQTDSFGNPGTATLSFSLDTTAPTETISSTIGTNTGLTTTISSGGLTKDNTLALSGTVSDTNGVSSVHVFDGATDLGAATLDGLGGWSLTTAALSDGSHSFTAKATDTAGNVTATSAVAATVDTTAPTIAINTIASNNIINAAKASRGFAISGTSTGAENGQAVTVNILNSANAVVDSYTTTDQNNAWSVRVTSAQATALADGSYTVTANVADKAGNPALQASHALTVDEEKVAEPPTLTIASTSLTVLAGGSVSLGITATPVDPDDRVQVKINGLPSYERITAPAGDNVSRQLQSNGTYNWTITESASVAGTPLTGLTLSSSYTGTGHPVAALTVTASNVTSGETASSASQILTVTDPPAAPAGGALIAVTDPPATTASSSQSILVTNPATALPDFKSAGHPSPAGLAPSGYAALAGLLEQYMAVGSGQGAPGVTSLMASQQAWLGGEKEFLTKPQC